MHKVKTRVFKIYRIWLLRVSLLLLSWQMFLKPSLWPIKKQRLLSDALTLLGQVQYNLSVRRRYIIRPNLKKKYTSLCNISTPISNQLFGDDIAKEIKNCDSMYGLGKDQGYRMNVYRGRGSRSKLSTGNSNRFLFFVFLLFFFFCFGFFFERRKRCTLKR